MVTGTPGPDPVGEVHMIYHHLGAPYLVQKAIGHPEPFSPPLMQSENQEGPFSSLAPAWPPLTVSSCHRAASCMSLNCSEW